MALYIVTTGLAPVVHADAQRAKEAGLRCGVAAWIAGQARQSRMRKRAHVLIGSNLHVVN
jgi:hypothetical protein